MKGLLKFIKYSLLALLLLVIIGSAIGYFYDDIAYTYNKITFEPPSEIHGVPLEDTYADIIFRFPLSELCDREMSVFDCDEESLWLDFGTSQRPDSVRVSFTDGIVSSVFDFGISFQDRRNYVVTDTETLLDYLGEPDILSISGNNLRRRYTYIDYGISYTYHMNTLDSLMIGIIEFRSIGGPNQEYYLYGNKICPGSDCPFDDEGNLKPENEGKTYLDFL